MASNRDWGVAPATLTQPPFAGPDDPAIILFPDPIPQEIITAVQNYAGVSWTVISAIQYRKTGSLYWFDAMAFTNFQYGIFRGTVFGSGSASGISNTWIYNTISAGASIALIPGILNQSMTIGELTNAGITITKAPSLTTPLVAIGAANGTLGRITLDVPSSGTIELTGGGINVTGATDLFGETDVFMQAVTDDFRVRDFGSGTLISLARGRRNSNQATSNSGAVGTTETVVITISNVVWRANRAYRCSFGPAITASLTTNVGQFRLRKTNAAGTLWGDAGGFGPSGAPPNIAAHGEFYVRRNTASDLTATVVLTLQASSSGTVTHIGQAAAQRYLLIEDCGDAADYPMAFAVT